MKKILVTGCCGLLGSELLKAGSKLGFQLFGIDNLSRIGSEKNITLVESLKNVSFERLDITNKELIDQYIKEKAPDAIFHVAGQVAMTNSIKNPFRDFEINAIGTLNILESIRKYKKDTLLIYASTNKVYGDINQLDYIESETRYGISNFKNSFSVSDLPINPCTPYGCSKFTGDLYCLDYARIFGLQSFVLRHSTIYGSTQFIDFNQGWVSYFVNQAKLLKKGMISDVQICGNGKQVRDILNVEDAANLYFAILKNYKILKQNVFNVGGGFENSISILELFNILEDKLKIKIPVIKNKARSNDQKVFISDNKDLIDIWKPSIDKIKGIYSFFDNSIEDFL